MREASRWKPGVVTSSGSCRLARFRLLFIFLAMILIVIQGVCIPDGAAADPITYVATQPWATGDADLTINKPPGTQEGDLLIANFYYYCTETDGAGPSSEGWEVLSIVNPSDYRYAAVLWKWAAAADANYTFTIPGADDDDIDGFLGAISAFRCVDRTTPFDATGTHQANYSNTITAPGITTTVDNAMVVFIAQVTADTCNPLSDWSAASLGTLTERYEYVTIGFCGVLGLAESIKSAAGPTGDGTADIFGDNQYDNAGMLIALKPGCLDPDAIPTLSQWGTIIFALLMTSVAILFLRKRGCKVRDFPDS